MGIMSLTGMINLADEEIKKLEAEKCYDDRYTYFMYTRNRLIEEYNFVHRERGIQWGDGQKPF